MDGQERHRLDERSDGLGRVLVPESEGVRRRDDDHPGIGQESRHFAVASGLLGDIRLVPIRQVGVQAVPEVFAVQEVGMPSLSHQQTLQLPRQEGLAHMPAPAEEHQRRPMTVPLGALLGMHLALDPGDIAATGFVP